MAIIVQKRTWSRQSLIPALIGFAICYSLAYNYFLFNAVPDHVHDDAECAATHVGDGNESPRCSEVRLFRSWHDADAMQEESDASLLAETFPASKVGEKSSWQDRNVSLEQQKVHGDNRQAVDVVTSEAEEIAAAEQVRLQQAQLRREKFDELEKQVRASLSQRSITPWAKHLMDEQKRMEAKNVALENLHNNRVLVHWQTDIDRLDSKVQVTIHADADAQWKKALANLKQLVQHHISVNSSTSVGHDEKMFALRHIQLDTLEEALNQTSSSKFSTQLAQLGSFAFEIKQMRTRLELEMSAQAMQGARDKGRAAEVADRTTKLESSLTDLILHHKAWDKKLATEDSASASRSLRGAQGAGKQPVSKVESTTSKPTGFMDKRLHWSSVTKMSQVIVTGAAHDAKTVVSKSELRHLHWGGYIPRVACITPISYSLHTKARMMYFIDNFKLQNYEGPKELVLVYSHSDSRAAKLVQKYADGSYIKGVAARDITNFPSNAALRYGAWSADADVVARWEFDEWHDPKRLSMQVRAMAAASKPACVLQPTFDLSSKPNPKEDAYVQETSLVGERSWMRAYWHPFLEEESANAVPPPPAHLVHLNMSTPQPKNDESQGKTASNLRAATTQEANKEAVLETKGTMEAAYNETVHEWTMDECLKLDTNVTWFTSDTEAAIDKNLGHDMSKMFHKLLAKRRHVTQRLVLLCIETTMKSDMKEHIFKRQHVDQMLGIRDELDKHLSTVAALYADQTPPMPGEVSVPVNAQGAEVSA